ncbi:hypothetical protein N7G274_006917 [Stereocaulon virgatum]|uniref:Uncharacterized protein n=1 Tax=Stereocaulon virgatum TaxID=373712 RepID=A0ABR4A6U1_9LECA
MPVDIRNLILRTWDKVTANELKSGFEQQKSPPAYITAFDGLTCCILPTVIAEWDVEAGAEDALKIP